jgi:hypothetical protein
MSDKGAEEVSFEAAAPALGGDNDPGPSESESVVTYRYAWLLVKDRKLL